MRAPSSGRCRRRTTTPTVARRSSPAPAWRGAGLGTGLLATLMVSSPCRRPYRAGLSGPVESQFSLSSTLARQAGHGRRVALVDDARAALDDVEPADGVRVLLVQLEEDDRQVALQVLLLVDREVDLS